MGTFFALALGITWTLQLPALLAQHGVLAGGVERYVGLAALGGFGPLLAAMVVTRSARAPFRLLGVRGVGAGWYAVAILGFAAVHLAARLVDGTGRWLYLPENPQQIAALILVPLAEEPGWRGLALPRLRQRHGALAASLILGVVWALWHTVMFLLQGATPLTFAASMVMIVAGSVVFGWLFERTGGSLVIALLAHAGAHLDNPSHALPGDPRPFVAYTVALVVVAAALAAVMARRRR
jgi:membrane protease YdiL (CAAX protease family)